MNILSITYPLNAILMIVVPIGLGVYLMRRFHLGWGLFLVGMLTFIVSQLGHIPFNSVMSRVWERSLDPFPPTGGMDLAVYALFLGLSAGLWEEWARYAAYRFVAKDARTWGQALLMGAGHGGVEAIILGGLVGLGTLNMLITRNMDLTAILPAEQVEGARQMAQQYWSVAWPYTLLPALERIFALTGHLAFSVLVLQAFLRRQVRWVWLAVGWHALWDAVAVFAAASLNVYAQPYTPNSYLVEGINGLLALANVAIIVKLRRPDIEPKEEVRPLPPLPKVKSGADIPEVEATAEKIKQTRYTYKRK
jgi:uncharacterized membrane protein YhfC